MIEGLRLLPWLKEAARRGDVGIADCSMCKANKSSMERRFLGCGYEPPIEGAETWTHRGYTGPEATVCPGYTTSLPQVSETAVARVHWSRGQPIGSSEDLSDAVVILEGAHNELQAWLLKPAKDGGGAG